MRLFEILAKTNKVAITNKFARNYPKFVSDYPGLPEVFMDFLDAKANGETFGTHDYKFVGPLSPFYHAHLDTDNALPVVIYDTSGDTIRLYDIILHKKYEGSVQNIMRKSLRKAKADGDFVVIDPKKVFSTGRPVSDVLKVNQKKQVEGEIAYLVANNAFETLSAAIIDNDWTELEDWLLEALGDPNLSKVAIYAAFDGKEGLANYIRTIIRHLGKKAEFNRFVTNQ